MYYYNLFNYQYYHCWCYSLLSLAAIITIYYITVRIITSVKDMILINDMILRPTVTTRQQITTKQHTKQQQGDTVL